MAEVAIAELVRLNSAETGPTEPPFSIEINSKSSKYEKVYYSNPSNSYRFVGWKYVHLLFNIILVAYENTICTT